MSWGRDRDRDDEPVQGLKALLRSLLPGIPWAERAETKETKVFAAPKSQVFKVRNLNGVTRITGEDRDDIEVTALKTARAESREAAEEMLEEIRLAFYDLDDKLGLEVVAEKQESQDNKGNTA